MESQWLSQLADEVRPLLLTYAHLILSALFPIYAGARSSLSYTYSAERPRDKAAASGDGSGDGGEDEDSSAEVAFKMEVMSASDTVLFPIVAGSMLTGLYVLISWFKVTDWLNLFLSWYFSIFSVFSVKELLHDGIQLALGFAFPRKYLYRGNIYSLSYKSRQARALKRDGEPCASPFPGPLSSIPLPESVLGPVWSLLILLRRKVEFPFWDKDFSSYKTVSLSMLQISCTILATIIGVGSLRMTIPWWLTNLFGFSFSYTALQLLSPKSFPIGSGLLVLLFFYDIYMVFRTPIMVTVATSLDIPIKLVFPRPRREDDPDPEKPGHMMLGLGDVVIPGLMVGLALRFDHYLYYHYRQVHRAEHRKDGKGEDVVVKLRYRSPSSLASVFWLTSWKGLFLGASSGGPAVTFPRPYFAASLVGYVLGLVSTLVSLHAMRHAQPALLFLVPCVVGALWLTGLVRGELLLMWNYDEENNRAGEEDEAEDIQETEKEREDLKESDKAELEESEKQSQDHQKEQAGEKDGVLAGIAV